MEPNFKNCPFRTTLDNGELVCGLAKKILKSEQNTLYVINDSICQRCYETNEIPEEKKINTVVAEILTNAATKVIAANGITDCTVEKAKKLMDYMNKQVVKPPCGCNKTNKLIRNIGKIR